MVLTVNKLLCGDCIVVMKNFPAESIDCIVTDPPYGYSFMGKDWDKAVPSIEVWKECLRVLKDGAFMFVMSAPRQDVLSEMIVRLGRAGFETGFTSMYWAYASGFPKALNIGKAVDKKLGIPMPIGKSFTVAGKHNEKVGDPTPIGEERDKMRYKPISEQAKQLGGSYGGFQPKPAVEIIIVCMKPLSEKTYVDQAMKNGKGVTWLDPCRIPTQKGDEVGFRSTGGFNSGRNSLCYGDSKGVKNTLYNLGRFPANLLVSDDVLNDGKIRKSQKTSSIGGLGVAKSSLMASQQKNKEKLIINYERGYNDSGGFSRYFDLDKWWEKKVEELPEEVKKTFPFLICPKVSKSERNKGCEDLEKQFTTEQNKWVENDYRKGAGEKTALPKGNFHPTVKPIKLMSYLVTLGSREGDVVLDPFVGSGTACIAAQALSRKWLGIEISREYCKIASARLGGAEVVELEGVPLPSKPVEARVGGKYICGYAGKCTYRSEDGSCLFKRPCKDKRIHCIHYILGE